MSIITSKHVREDTLKKLDEKILSFSFPKIAIEITSKT